MPRKKIPHFRFYIDDFINGTKDMSAAEVGDYVRLLAHLYDQGGRVPHQPDVLRHLLGCTRQVDAAAKIQRLIDHGKLFVDAHGYLHNGRTDKEIRKRQQWQDAHRLSEVTAPLPPPLSPSKSTKKPRKTKGASTLARATPSPSSFPSSTEHYTGAKNGKNGAAMASSPGGEGRSEATPPDSVHDPPPALQEKLAALAGEAVPAYLFEKLKRH